MSDNDEIEEEYLEEYEDPSPEETDDFEAEVEREVEEAAKEEIKEDFKEKMVEERKEEYIEEAGEWFEAVDAKEKIDEVKEAGAIAGAGKVLRMGAEKVAEKGSKLGDKVFGKGKEGKKSLQEAVPEGKSISKLTKRQQEYFAETGRWPKRHGRMTRDYIKWRQKQDKPKYAERSVPGKIFGGGREHSESFSRSISVGRISDPGPEPARVRSPIAMRKEDKVRDDVKPVFFPLSSPKDKRREHGMDMSRCLLKKAGGKSKPSGFNLFSKRKVEKAERGDDSDTGSKVFDF